LSLRARFASWFMDTLVPRVFPRLNPLALWLLKSPLHPLMSCYVILLCFEGRRTGKRYEVPIAYHRTRDGVIEAVTSAKGVWWRNLRGVPEISVVYRGALRRAKVEVVVGDAEVIARALRSRDLCRRLLLPASVQQTALLRVQLLPP